MPASLFQPRLSAALFFGISALAALPGAAGLVSAGAEPQFDGGGGDTGETRCAPGGAIGHKTHDRFSLIQTGTAITDMRKESAVPPGGLQQPAAPVDSPGMPPAQDPPPPLIDPAAAPPDANAAEWSLWQSLAVVGNVSMRVLATSPSEAIAAATGFHPSPLKRPPRPVHVLVARPSTEVQILQYALVTLGVGALAWLQVRGGIFARRYGYAEGDTQRGAGRKPMRRQQCLIELPRGIKKFQATKEC